MKLLLIMVLLVSTMYASKYGVSTYIPDRAKTLMPTIVEEVSIVVPEYNEPWYFGSLIEHESCVRLHGTGYWARRCYSPVSELLTHYKNGQMREQGVGMFQLSRAFKKDGRKRLDIIATLRKKHAKELHELNWENVKDRPDLQIKAGLLLWKDNYNMLAKTIPEDQIVYFADSVYNGGWRLLNKERKICKLRKGCDPDVWFGNVENIKDIRNKHILYGKRTAYDINRHHVKDVMKTRLPKYTDYIHSKIVKCYDHNGTREIVYEFK